MSQNRIHKSEICNEKWAVGTNIIKQKIPVEKRKNVFISYYLQLVWYIIYLYLYIFL